MHGYVLKFGKSRLLRTAYAGFLAATLGHLPGFAEMAQQVVDRTPELAASQMHLLQISDPPFKATDSMGEGGLRGVIEWSALSPGRCVRGEIYA